MADNSGSENFGMLLVQRALMGAAAGLRMQKKGLLTMEKVIEVFQEDTPLDRQAGARSGLSAV